MAIGEMPGNSLDRDKKRPVKTINHRFFALQLNFGGRMTSISAASANVHQSPLQRLQAELQSEVSSGTISSSDQDALSSALSDIDSSLQASRSSDEASGTRPSPDSLKSKIDDLISGEVSSGKLTSDQATELKQVFANTFSGGPGGAPPTDSTSSTDATPASSSTSSSSDSSSSSDDIDQLLKKLLSALQNQMGSSGAYTANGSTSASSNSSLLLNYTA